VAKHADILHVRSGSAFIKAAWSRLGGIDHEIGDEPEPVSDIGRGGHNLALMIRAAVEFFSKFLHSHASAAFVPLAKSIAPYRHPRFLGMARRLG